MTNRTMNALMVTELGRRAELRTIPLPRPAEGEVLIRVHYSGVSVGTEMWIAHGKRHDYGAPPFVNGYQVTGEVVEIGGDGDGQAEGAATDVAVGSMVAAFVSGAHAQFVTAKRPLVHALPDAQCARPAALFVQPSVAANALNEAGVAAGDTVLVVGQGLIGQATAQLARLRGAYVIASDVSDERLEISRRHCADWVIDANDGPVSKQLRERFANGVDVVLESTGFEALLDDALRCCRSGGRFVFEGFYPGQIRYDFSVAHSKQLRAYYPVFIGPPPVREGVLRLIATGHLAMDALISHPTPWREAEDVYNALFTDQRHHFNGIVFDWPSDARG